MIVVRVFRHPTTPSTCGEVALTPHTCRGHPNSSSAARYFVKQTDCPKSASFAEATRSTATPHQAGHGVEPTSLSGQSDLILQGSCLRFMACPVCLLCVCLDESLSNNKKKSSNLRVIALRNAYAIGFWSSRDGASFGRSLLEKGLILRVPSPQIQEAPGRQTC